MHRRAEKCVRRNANGAPQTMTQQSLIRPAQAFDQTSRHAPSRVLAAFRLLMQDWRSFRGAFVGQKYRGCVCAVAIREGVGQRSGESFADCSDVPAQDRQRVSRA
jgi:hypothetical protein